MEQLAKYDPYSIDEIQFYIEKKTKYTTLKSVIISIVIFCLTIVVNYDSLNDIWADRNSLVIESSNQKLGNTPLTSNFLCVIDKYSTIQTFNSTLQNQLRATNQVFKTFYSTTKFNKLPDVLRYSKGRYFTCYDLQSAYLNQLQSLALTVWGKVQILMKTYTLNQILGNEAPNYYYYSPAIQTGMKYRYQCKKVLYVLYDSLLIDYMPQEILGVKNQLVPLVTTNVDASSLYSFASETFKQSQITEEIIVTRKNIGQILGNFFSWLAIFILLFTYFISPIVDYTFKVQVCKNIYQNQYLDKISVSILSYLRYLLSRINSLSGKRICQGQNENSNKNRKCVEFNEGILDQVFQELESDLNIVHLIKKQIIMKKLIKEHKYIQTNKQPETINQEQNNQDIKNSDIQLLLVENSKRIQSNGYDQQKSLDNQNQIGQIIDSSDISERTHQSNKIFEVQKDQLIKQSIAKQLVTGLDIGQTAISLISNKGQGYRTSWNTILTTIFFVVILWFLIFAGMFRLSETTTTKTLLFDHQQTSTPTTMAISPSDIIFRAIKAPTDTFTFEVKLLNQNYDIIDNVTLLNGTACDQYVIGLNETVGSGWLCLPKEYLLSNDGKNKKISIGARFTFPTAFGFTVSNLEATLRQNNLNNGELSTSVKRIVKRYVSTQFNLFQIQTIDIVTPQDQFTTFTSYKEDVLLQTSFKGMAFEIMNQKIYAQTQQKTIWDVIDTAWGIFILAFSILLTKITNYLNVKKRQKITTNQQNQNRNNVVSIISAQHQLIYKYFNVELGGVKYFCKSSANAGLNKEE